MFIVLGATGHVGSEAAKALLEAGEPVTVVTRDAAKAGAWRTRGAEVAEADVNDVERLRAVFRRGRRAFVLNPPADPKTDTDAVERATVRNLLAALDGSGLEKVVAESTAGAQPGERCGDLTVLWELEEGLRAQAIPASIVRAAYYFSNWDGLLESARDDGVLPTVLPADLKIPMAAPADLGRTAARLLREPVGRSGTHHVEGPQRYSSGDVADAFARALGRPVRVVVTPRERWVQAFRDLGFSEPAAQSYAKMTAATVDGTFVAPEAAIRGSVTLDDYIGQLVRTPVEA
jgi:uncharacterized protein YbjT (DUF2867 family)